MSSTYKTVYRGGEATIEEKKSRFIAHISPVADEKEAAEFINGIKKKYWDARHNCSAFIIGNNRNIMRSSDDGEPSGTAGKPMLEVLLGENLTDVAAVVTRYFGGILLGTGGLIRAYTRAVKEALAECALIEKKQGIMVTLSGDYTLEGFLRRFIKDHSLPLMSCVYSEGVELDTVIELSLVDDCIDEIIKNTDGRARIHKADEISYALADGEVILY